MRGGEGERGERVRGSEGKCDEKTHVAVQQG